jgi:hypothetical protein
MWNGFYPLGLDSPAEAAALAAHTPELGEFLAAHRPATLHGLSLREVLRVHERTPRRLRQLWRDWSGDIAVIAAAPPTLAFAVIGQARADGHLRPAEDGELHAQLLQAWALASSVSFSSRPPLIRSPLRLTL